MQERLHRTKELLNKIHNEKLECIDLSVMENFISQIENAQHILVAGTPRTQLITSVIVTRLMNFGCLWETLSPRHQQQI